MEGRVGRTEEEQGNRGGIFCRIEVRKGVARRAIDKIWIGTRNLSESLGWREGIRRSRNNGEPIPVNWCWRVVHQSPAEVERLTTNSPSAANL